MTSHSSSRALVRRRNNDHSGEQRRESAPVSRERQAPNLYEQVTDRIISELEAGRLPWVQPWGKPGEGTGCAPALPRNALSGREYSGVNILLLWSEVIAKGYPSQRWLTFRQALEAGGTVRKGEHGCMVVYADRFIPQAEKAHAQDSGEEARAVPFLKRFTVFNVAQCEGLEGRIIVDPDPLPEREIVLVAEEVIAASGIDFRIGGDKAYYVPSLDYVQVPPQQLFFEQVNFYRTALHELTHATGHASRLARDLSNGFGSTGYAREELNAELGSAFLCASLGIVPTVRHADYIGAWLAVLREDSRAIFRAARAASLAADWLLEKHRASRDSDGGTEGNASASDTGAEQGRMA
ncbi:ArdC family protein [Sphingobium chlorophenolicum]|uniref:Antirestriction protein ArdC n=1 Tax=Sphingobium chlorophenolicum TaxID=46429 RepID=A0A081R9F8_SPHCR|nr:zincin-like metallopeptidase domain-containing protein [Sphingobium chlorophenolicum]KEQ51831.1 Antirestriction protein ArdC [Sphingobium chlorophenolicum]